MSKSRRAVGQQEAALRCGRDVCLEKMSGGHLGRLEERGELWGGGFSVVPCAAVMRIVAASAYRNGP